ncbi:unnamed protein product [Gongylonema pulchrum]|uniref:MFS domain-containing protein n=1 Tax=Gongylonema pulchrum TaxID=637853 RepID=A0A183E1A1_9BILA|nr:unnamed protein product [Gongylonema pulchrum]
MERNQRVLLILCAIYGLWNIGTQWTTTLLSFLQWDTIHVMTIVDIGYIQSFGSFCNAFGALAVGQLADTTGPKTMFLFASVIVSIYYSALAFARCWYSFFFLQDYLPMVKHNTALREGIILRGLLIAAYVCYELISRNFMLRSFMQGPNDSAKVLIVMGASLLTVQFLVLPWLQRRFYPRTVLIIALSGLVGAYSSVNFTTNLNQLLVIVALQTACYAVAYAESCTQITSAVDMADLGKATGLASAAQWIVHFIVPIYTSHLVQSWHYTYAFYTSALLSLGTLCFIILVAKHSNARVRTLLPSISLA